MRNIQNDVDLFCGAGGLSESFRQKDSRFY